MSEGPAEGILFECLLYMVRSEGPVWSGTSQNKGCQEETALRRKIMVLFDPETEYAVRFMEYISRKGSIPLEVHVFTDFNQVKTYIAGGRADILLV